VGTNDQRKQDGYDTVEWIAKQPWCNGKVGMWGSSALGGAQFATASKQPPHLICMEPRVADFSNSYGSYYFGGVMRKEYLEGLRLASWGALADIIAAHPLDDGFYDGKDTADPEDIKTPALLIGGWWDIHDMPRVYNSLLKQADPAAAKNFRMMICPNSHTNIARDGPEGELEFPGSGPFARNEQKKFFDYWLRGADGGFANSQPIAYYQMGADEWRTASQWPPAGMKKVSYYLNDGNALATVPVAGNLAVKKFIFDPNDPVPTAGGNIFQPGLERGPIDQSRKVEKHKDVLIFSSEVLTENVTIDGEIEANLYVSSDSADTDVAIRVTDVYPDGRSMIVRDGIQRLSHMDGDKVEKFITPGTVYPVTVKTYSVGQTFLKGHRIRLIVSASNYPRYGVNNGSQDRNAAPKMISDSLCIDAGHTSALILPVLTRQ
jgi:putative CocE/NonD family hydrolase